MHKTIRYLALAAATLLTSATAFAESHEGMHGMAQGDIQVQHAYVRAVPPGQPNSAAFMTLHNKGNTANAVVGASSPAAEVVELHTHIMDEGMMKMRKIERIDIAPAGMTELKPGGLHVMLIGLKQQLQPGMKVNLTLKFADGSEQMITAPVQAIMESMGHSMDSHHPMQH